MCPCKYTLTCVSVYTKLNIYVHIHQFSLVNPGLALAAQGVTVVCLSVSHFICICSVSVCMYMCVCAVIYSASCLVSTWVSTYYYFTQSLAHVHYICQPVLIVSTSDEKYRFGVPFNKLDCIRMYVHELTHMYTLYVHANCMDNIIYRYSMC